MYTATAMVHSLNAPAEVTILHEKRNSDVIAEYKGVRCTAIFNPFVCSFYVDDVYGVLPDQHKCPICGEYIA